MAEDQEPKERKWFLWEKQLTVCVAGWLGAPNKAKVNFFEYTSYEDRVPWPTVYV